MQLRGSAAALAGVCAAATGHALDVSGRLPFVHEAETVRTAMTPVQLASWLAAAAALSAVAARTRPVLVGTPAALAVSAAPELVGRHDAGAVIEPGAVLGALLQLLLVVAVVAIAVLLERRVVMLRLVPIAVQPHARRSRNRLSLRAALVDRIAAPRAPPGHVVATT